VFGTTMLGAITFLLKKFPLKIFPINKEVLPNEL